MSGVQQPEAGEWECFPDPAYFDMHCVRLIGERTFGKGFHLASADEAKALCELLNSQTKGRGNG